MNPPDIDKLIQKKSVDLTHEQRVMILRNEELWDKYSRIHYPDYPKSKETNN